MQTGKTDQRKNAGQGRSEAHPTVGQHTADSVKALANEHAQKRTEQAAQQSGETGRSEYIGSLVYGALDGIITTFAIASGVVGAGLSPGIILVLGLANVLGDGFSMATGAYLSSKSEQEVYEHEQEHAAEKISQSPEDERKTLAKLYVGRNYLKEDARKMVEIVSKDPGRWVSTMLIEQLMLLSEKRKPLMEGLATFIAFLWPALYPGWCTWLT